MGMRRAFPYEDTTQESTSESTVLSGKALVQEAGSVSLVFSSHKQGLKIGRDLEGSPHGVPFEVNGPVFGVVPCLEPSPKHLGLVPFMLSLIQDNMRLIKYRPRGRPAPEIIE